MNLLLLFGLFPSEEKKTIIKNSKNVVQYAADALQWSFLRGMMHFNKKIQLINLPYIGSFPKFYNKINEKSYDFSIYDNLDLPKAKNINFINIVGIRLLSRYINSKNAIEKWVTNTLGEKVIIIYAIHLPFLEAAIKIKRKFSDVKICLIVPDLPEYMGEGNWLYKISKKIINKRIYKLYSDIDYYVLLSEYMKNVIPIKGDNYVVIEGIYDDIFSKIEDENVNLLIDNEKDVEYIFYGGTLAHRYGILNLVNAFIKLQNKKYRLIICGDGAARREIEEIAKVDTRIIYKGQLPREEVLRLIKKSDLLVNPRTSDGEYTLYSFPSKTMEYLGSGVPTLLYKLKGIPAEYYDYCYTLEDNSIESLSFEIDRILSLPKIVRSYKGAQAKKFIEDNKSTIKQSEKLIKLITK